MSLSKSIFIFFFILAGMYLGINSLLAIPEIDDDKTKSRELVVGLKEDLQNIKSSFSSHLNDLSFDTITYLKFDSICRGISHTSNAGLLKSLLASRIRDQKLVLDNQIDIYYYSYLNANLTGLNHKKRARNVILSAYKDACSRTEDELFNRVNAVRVGIDRLYMIFLGDTSVNYRVTRAEYKEILSSLRFNSLVPPLQTDLGQKATSTLFAFFIITNYLVRDESQTLALIVGLIGFGLLGAIIGTFGRTASAPDLSTRSLIISNIYNTIIKSFSASLLTYLSIKGGISVITSNSENSANPYFVLLVCFVAAVFSEEIWEWAKKKILPAS